MPERDWNARYAEGDLPWDTGVPDHHLVEVVERGGLPRGRLFEVGCGTGTNAVWLAAEGFTVLGVDVSPIAVDRAIRRRVEAGLSEEACRFEVQDFLAAPPEADAFDAVYDRGVFHVFDDAADRARYAAHVAHALRAGGVWVSVLGSTEGPERDHGPPRRTARDIVLAVEPALEVVSLTSMRFEPLMPAHVRGWLLEARKRSTPAQPSTGSGS